MDIVSSPEDEQLFRVWLVSGSSDTVPLWGDIRVTRNGIDYIWPRCTDIAFSALVRDIKECMYTVDSFIITMKVLGVLGTYKFLSKEAKKIFRAVQDLIMLHKDLVQLNKRQFGATSETASVEGSDCGYVEREFTKEEVEELLNKKFDHKGIAQQSATYHEDLKDCIKWYRKVEKDHPLQVERLRNLLNAAEKKCADTDEINAINSKLRQTIATLEEKLAKEESEKMDAIHSQRMEKVAAEKLQVALSGELEKVWEERLVIEQRAIKFEFDNNQTQEDNKRLQIEVNTMIELRKQNNILVGQLQEVRDDRDRRIKENHDLMAEVLKHVVQSDTSSLKIKDSEMAGSSASEITQNERVVRELRARILELEQKIFELEQKIFEGERLRRKLHNDIQELKGNIRVFCRVRPLLCDDATAADVPVISYPTSTEGLGCGIDLVKSGQKYHFTFDKVFDHGASQHDVFVDISQLVQSALDGYKVCIFAYGQTGSGKTYTMMGRPETPDQMGLIPRSLDQIFHTIQSLQAQGREYKMQASVLEIYNDTIRDLLSTNQPSGAELTRTKSGVGKQYTIQHDVNGNTNISDLTIIHVCSKGDISSLLERATRRRSVGKTQMNEQSSRSHLVFTLRISWINENSKQKVQGVLNLIDLAGSERVSSSGATGDRLKETKAIDSSLSFLGDVMSALSNKEGHVPFRNSKLTHLLQPCLEGDSKALMFVNVSPTSVEESLRSLQFAERVHTCELRARRRQTTARPS